MGQHFLFHRDLVAATAVHHTVNARLSNDVEADLVLVGPQWLRLYRIEPFPSSDAPMEVTKGHVLHLLVSFPLAGVAESVHVLRFDRNLLRKKHRFMGGEDVLLLTFPRFKWVIVGYDRRSRTLATLAMFSFEEDAIGPGATLKGEKNGREQLLGIGTQAIARVDPQTRCGAMLVYSDQLVFVPFRSESMELSFFEEDDDEMDEEERGSTTADSEDEDDDDEEEKQLEQLVNESKQREVTSDMNTTLTALLDKSVKVGNKRKRKHSSGLMPNEITGREFLLRLRELDITGKIVDFAFLDGYLEPTLMVLHEENERNSTFGRLAVGFDTFCLTVMSINMNTRLHPKIWTVKNLPSDSFRLIPCRAPLGGVVVLSANALLYFNQTQFHGLATNGFAPKTVNYSVFPLQDAVYETPDHETAELNILLHDCQYAYLNEKELLLTVPSGEVFVLSLPYEDTSNRGLYGVGGSSASRSASLSLRMVQSGIVANCLSVNSEKKTVFVGSRSGDSLLFALDQKIAANGASELQQDRIKDEPMAENVDLIKAEETEKEEEEEEEEEEDEDDLFLYGSASTLEEAIAPKNDAHVVENKLQQDSNMLEERHTGPYDYKLRQIDVLPGIGQITSIELGVESNADSKEKREELVISGGYERNGAISVLHNGLRPIVGTEAELSGCRAMWTVSSSLPSSTQSSDGRSYNAYLILSVAQRTMVLRTGEGMEPLEDDCGFYLSGPTLAAANLFNRERIVQIFKQGARVMMEVPEAPKAKEKNKDAVNMEAEEAEEEEEEGMKVKLVCTQEITLEGDVECGGMNVDTSSVGIVSVDVADPYILLLLTDGSVRLLMGDEDDMELTVIDPEIDYLDGMNESNETMDASKHGSSSACLFYDWAGMFSSLALNQDERNETSEEDFVKNEVTKECLSDEDEDMDALYRSTPRERANRTDSTSKQRSEPHAAVYTNTDGSISFPLLQQQEAKMMCGLCFGDGSLHVFSLPDFTKRGVFPYLTFAPQFLVNTLETWPPTTNHTSKSTNVAAPALGLNASTSSANDGRIKKSHTINSPVADLIIHRVGPSEGQQNAQYLARMVLLVFLANGDLLLYTAMPTFDSFRPRSATKELAPVFQFVRVGTDLITRPFLPPRARSNGHPESGTTPEVNTSAVLAKLRAGFRYPMLTSFANVNNMSGVFFRGAHPMWILGDRGHPSFIPMCVAGSVSSTGTANTSAAPKVSVPVLSFTPFHHWNCPNGFIYFHSRGALRVCELPSSKTSTILPASGGFVLQKADFGATLHHMLYLGNHGPGGVAEALEAPTYAIVCSISMKPGDAERATAIEGLEEEQEAESLDANGNPVGSSNVMAPTAEMFPEYAIDSMPHAAEDVYELRLVQTNEFGEWGRSGVFRVHFERSEVVLSMQLMYLYDSSLLKDDVSSVSLEWNKKKRPYLVVGTGWVGPHGEDESGRGRLLLYELDYAQYVNEEGGATSGKLPKLRLVFIKEHRQGAISMVAQLGPYVLAAVGSKLIVYEFKSEQLVGCAFYDAQMFIVTLNVVKDFVMYGDVYKSVHFLRWRENQRQLLLLAKDYEPLAVSATEFSVFEKKLALLAVDMDENLHVLQFAPQDIESRGGQRLLRVSDFHLGIQVASMFRKRVDSALSAPPGRATASLPCYVNIFGTSEGGVGALIPVSERVFRRLFTLQNVMINTLPQNCALNPREFRMLKTNAQRRCGRPDAWSKKKWKKSFLDALVLFRFLALDYVAQKELARCIGTTPEVVIHNLLEVQQATATFL